MMLASRCAVANRTVLLAKNEMRGGVHMHISLDLRPSHRRFGNWQDVSSRHHAYGNRFPSFLQLRPLRLYSRHNNFQTINFRYYFNTRRVIPKQGSDSISAKTVPLVSASKSNWTRFAWYVKIARLPFLISAIYALGYQQGVMQTASNPLKLQQGFFETICIDMGVESSEDIDIISERRPVTVKRGWMTFAAGSVNTEETQKHHPRTVKVANIGRNIIRAARLHVREELNKAVQAAQEKLKNETGLSELELRTKIHEDDEVAKWLAAQLRIEGETLDGIENWQYILVGTPVPNAFVSQLLPQRFFVTTGLFDQFVTNDDELAMILGHEISHLILGHLSASNNLEFFFRGAELFILAIDPTEGLMSLGVAGFLASTRDWLLAAFSRENETEADELGCKLAAMACYDTIRGSKVFLRMHEFDEKIGQAKKDVLSTHPPSKERYDNLVKLTQDENLSKYSQCQGLRNRLARALTLAQQKPGNLSTD